MEEGRIPGRVLRRSQKLNQESILSTSAGNAGKKHKLDPSLPHGIGPGHPARGFDARPRIGQIEAQKNLLVYVQRSYGLNGQTRVTQIADDAAVALIQIDISQALNLVAVVTSPAERREGDCFRLDDGATRKSMAKF